MTDQRRDEAKVDPQRQRGRDEVIEWLDGRINDDLLFRLVAKFGTRHDAPQPQQRRRTR